MVTFPKASFFDRPTSPRGYLPPPYEPVALSLQTGKGGAFGQHRMPTEKGCPISKEKNFSYVLDESYKGFEQNHTMNNY